MKGRSVLPTLSLLVLALGCENSQQPTGVGDPNNPSKIILDGAHGGNQDFFFLPPLVPLPTAAQGFEAGQFNMALRPSLTVEICRLMPENLDSQQLPTPTTPCYKNGPLDKFAAGTVKLVNNPATETGWWTGLNLPPDGFFYVQWDTHEAHLNAEKFYRVKVFIDGSTVPLGMLDIDPMKREREFQTALVGQVVQVVDGILLPIPFRVENGALCQGATLCTSQPVTNDGATVTVDDGGEAIAGARFPEGWLPEGGPQSVVVTIREVPSSEAEDGSFTRTIPCHVGLPYQQFNKCFQFTTIPALAEISPGVQFAEDVTVAVCYRLYGTADPRRDYAELYASGPGEPPHALPDVSDVGILSALARNCTPSEIIGVESSNPVTRLANTGWRSLKGGLTQLFGVKTAYAVDGGLGGIIKGFSNVGPALTAQIESFSATEVTLEDGETSTLASVRIYGSQVHGGEGAGAVSGIDSVPVTFTVASGNGTLAALGSEESLAQVTVNTSTFGEGDVGVASVMWTPPTVPGTYHMTATGPATGGPVIFTAIVVAPPVAIDGVLSPGEWDGAATYNFTANLPSGGQTPAMLMVKNDGQNLYLAVKFARTTVDAGDNRLGFEFDTNNDGAGPSNGDDYFVFQFSPFSVFSDAFRSGGGSSVTTDTQADGAGAFHNDGAYSVYEISHPLNSGQAGQDFALAGGSTIGLFFQLIIGGVTTTYPGPFIQYLPITITGG